MILLKIVLRLMFNIIGDFIVLGNNIDTFVKKIFLIKSRKENFI